MALKNEKGGSLQKTQAFALILASLIPLIIATFFTLLIIMISVRNETAKETNTLNSTVNYQINQFFTVPSVMMYQLKGMLEINEEIHSHQDTDAHLNLSLDAVPFFNRIMVLDHEGKVLHLVPFNEDFLEMDFSKQPFFKEGFQRGEIRWSPIFISSITGKPLIAATIDFKFGKIVGYINIAHLIELVGDIEISHGGYAVVTDQDGTMIVHPDKLLMEQRVNISNEEAVIRAVNGEKGELTVRKDNHTFLCAYSQVSNFNWILLVYQDKKELYSTIYLLIKLILVILTITIGTSIIMSLYISKRILHPLDLLNKITEKIGIGEYDSFFWKKSYKEFDSLADNYSRMVQAVKTRENEIDNLRRHLSSIIDSMPSLVIGVDSEFSITLWNKRAQEVIKIKSEEAVGQKIMDVFPFLEDYRDMIVKCLYQQEILSLNKIKSENIELGSYIDILMFPLISNDKKEVGIRIDDMTSIVNSELIIQQSDKLNSLGKLSAGISHDLNNMLTPILGYGELLEDKLKNDPESVAFTIQIQEAAMKAQKLVRQLLVFSKKQQLNYNNVNINQLLGGFKKLLDHSLPENIDISYILKEALPPIRADEGQLEQVVMNLSINGRDAMPDGGDLTFETDYIRLEKPLNNQWKWRGPEDFVTLAISDTGFGMSDETLSRIFEPFYSTKGRKGTGLGLSMVYGIIEQHNGYISVQSELLKGTKFTFFLPVVAESNPLLQESQENKKEIITHGGKILLVEDDFQVIELIKTFLQKEKFHVVPAKNGFDALSIFEKDIEAFDLVLTDVIMPKISGRELVQKLREKKSDLPVVFMSGYTDNIVSEKEWDGDFTAFIEKPFKFNDLLDVILRISGKSKTTDTV
ncbi:MAG: response regulator [Spirochaetales bacterium]|nr:response regulator [Spirochaetales bacterium]